MDAPLSQDVPTDITLTSFIVYDGDGVIFQVGRCPANMIEQQASPGMNIMFGEANFQTDYIADGVVVTFTAEEMALRSNPPAGWIWKMPERTVIDVRPLEEAKQQAWDRAKGARSAAEFSNFECDGNIFDGNKASRDRITGAFALALAALSSGQTYSINWTLRDNTVVLLDGPAMLRVGAAMGAATAAVFDKARTLRETIDACTTNAQCDAITWAVDPE